MFCRETLEPRVGNECCKLSSASGQSLKIGACETKEFRMSFRLRSSAVSVIVVDCCGGVAVVVVGVCCCSCSLC